MYFYNIHADYCFCLLLLFSERRNFRKIPSGFYEAIEIFIGYDQYMNNFLILFTRFSGGTTLI